MSYQSFPDELGNSRSSDKLSALRLPDLAEKSFLDVGCNEGFFCGYAEYSGANRVVGIDTSKRFIERAKMRFPDCEFIVQSWDDISLGSFDCILLASAIHYADDQEALIASLMKALTPDGVLVLEMGIVSAAGSVWKEVERAIDKRTFPSLGKLQEILAPYAWKLVGDSVNQDGDPIRRYVVHITAMRPYAFLALSEPGSGKSTLAREIFSRNLMRIIIGDRIYRQITENSVEVSDGLQSICDRIFRNDNIDQLTYEIISAGYMKEIAEIWCTLGGGEDCFVDSYVPAECQTDVVEVFSKGGYYPVMLKPCETASAISVDTAQKKSDAYLKKLVSSKPKKEKIRVKSLSNKWLSRNRDLRWHIDQPQDGDFVSIEGMCLVSGWVFYGSGESGVEVFFESKDISKTIPLTVVRQDVIKHFETRGVTFSTQMNSNPVIGFQYEFSVHDRSDQLTFGFLLNGKKIPIAKIF